MSVWPWNSHFEKLPRLWELSNHSPLELLNQLHELCIPNGTHGIRDLWSKFSAQTWDFLFCEPIFYLASFAPVGFLGSSAPKKREAPCFPGVEVLHPSNDASFSDRSGRGFSMASNDAWILSHVYDACEGRFFIGSFCFGKEQQKEGRKWDSWKMWVCCVKKVGVWWWVIFLFRDFFLYNKWSEFAIFLNWSLATIW